MKASIILFPGSNRENDMAMALKSATGRDPTIVWHKETDLGTPDLIVLPGGFSYGDYLRCGAMAAHSPVMKEVIRLAERGTKVLGVCNGFQMLVETHLLPGALMRNSSLKFICKQVHLRAENTSSVFSNKFTKGQVIRVPIAHGEGNYFADASTLDALEQNDRIAFRYCNEDGQITSDSNPNGSLRNIAGVLNKAGNVMGMMPHPENATQNWHANDDGAPLFNSILKSLG